MLEGTSVYKSSPLTVYICYFTKSSALSRKSHKLHLPNYNQEIIIEMIKYSFLGRKMTEMQDSRELGK